MPSARLRISHTNGQDLVFFAKVYDVAPDGTATLIHRLIAPVRVPAAAVDEPVRIKLPGFAHRFAKGHRVRLVLCSTDQTSYNAKVADVHHRRHRRRSTFTLPGVLPRVPPVVRPPVPGPQAGPRLGHRGAGAADRWRR